MEFCLRSEEGGLALRSHYIITQSEKEAVVQRVESTEVLNLSDMVSRGIVSFRVCDTEEEADRLAASWNKKFQESHS